MNPAVPESDLLAFIEGDLAPERAREVHEALRADPEMRRLVDALQSDRELIGASLNRAASGPALGLAAAAIAEAARQSASPAVLPSSPRQAEPRRLRIGPVLSLAAAAAIAVLALIIFWPASRTTDLLAGGQVMGPTPDGLEDTSPPKRRPHRFEVPAPKSQQSAPGLPTVLDQSGDDTIEFSPSESRYERPPAIRTPEQAARDNARDRRMRELFSNDATDRPENFERQLTEAGRAGWRAGLEVGGMDLGRAAQLAITSRLRIVVESSNPDALRRRAGFMNIERAPGGALAAGAAEGDAAASEAISVDFPMDPELAGLQDALARVAESIEGDGDALVRFEEVPEGSELAEGASVVPATDVDSVLWWRLPSDRWTISSSVAVPIEFVTP